MGEEISDENSTVTAARTVIIGAGPAGLTAAYQLGKAGRTATVLEAEGVVGGISQTAERDGWRFDIGGHRFFTKVKPVSALWHEILPDEDFLLRPRMSRIYYQGKFYDYPLKAFNALGNLGIIEAVRCVLSYGWARINPPKDQTKFEGYVAAKFGWRLYRTFFKTYTEKVWGMPCSEIGADWAAQRIKNLDLVGAIRQSLLGSAGRGGAVVTTLIESFQYPRLGPGMLWERCRDLLQEKGTPTLTGLAVTRVLHDGERVRAVEAMDREGRTERFGGSAFISSMPIRDLVRALDPAPPEDVLAAAESLRYRDFLTVALVVERRDLFPDNWIYIHSPKVRVGRIQNFKNWSPEMVPDDAMTSLGFEYFVQEGDDLWTSRDEDLIALARRECAELGFAKGSEIVDGAVVRMPKAYPVYDSGYRDALATIRGFLDGLGNLQLVGRNGQHRYNNQDHSMLTALYAVRNLAGASYDVWDVNVEAAYHEEVKGDASPGGDRTLPVSIPLSAESEAVRQAFARYDPRALAGAVAVVLGIGVFLVTAMPLAFGRDGVIPLLSLLGNYLYGYQPTWDGALLGLLEGAALGGAFGFVLAHTINRVVTWHENIYRREAELARSLGAVDDGMPRP